LTGRSNNIAAANEKSERAGIDLVFMVVNFRRLGFNNSFIKNR
jgi:hypothetical protein